MDQKLDHSETVNDLGIHVSDNLTWIIYIEERLRKANKVLYLLRRNVAVKVQTFVKLGLYQFVVLWGHVSVIDPVKWITLCSRADSFQFET